MFRDLPQYLNHQETSMPWCPSIPDHWHMSRNKALLEPKHEKVGLRSSDYDLLSLTKAGVIYRDIDGGKGKMPAAFDDYQAIEDGDLIMCLFDVDETPRTVGRARQRGMITGAYNRFVVEDEVLAEYLNLFYKSVDDVKGLRPLYRGLRKTVPIDSFLSSQVPLPPVKEQAAIVKYLAHANARIDNVIAAKRRLIALLEEQMRVLVERAISECTASLERLGFHIDLVTGFPFKSEDFRTTGGDGQRPLLRGINVGVGSLSSTDYVFVDEDIAQLAQSFELRAGDLVLGMDRPVIAKGVRLAEITSQQAGCLLVQRVARLRTKSTLEPSYLQTVFRSAAFTQYLEPIFTGISVPHLSPKQIRDLPLPMPTIDEQRAIVAAVGSSTTKLESAVNVAAREVVLLQEFRTRLVADVVTGQVDVRAVAETLPDPSMPDVSLDEDGIDLDDLYGHEDD